MKIFYIFSLLAFLQSFLHAQLPVSHYEKSNFSESDTYEEVIAYYQALDKVSEYIKLISMGETDSGFPLHLVLISKNPEGMIKGEKTKDQVTVLINNAIHPGEPDGMQACMLLARKIADNTIKLSEHIQLAIIPVYNIGGSLDRSTFYRIDQNGPIEKGRRSNSLNYDLNRDFIKCDTKESLAFADIFHMLLPEVFIDTHTSNGADYQHTMTLLTSQHNKLGGSAGQYLHKKMEPALFNAMKIKGMDMIPYVNNFGPNPENGWEAFWDSPRYSSGYTTLFSTLSFVPETHMLKPFKDRVDATFALLQCMVDFCTINHKDVYRVVNEQRARTITQKEYPIQFKVDTTKYQMYDFKGYKATYKPSEISGLPRLHYDRSQPMKVKVKFYNYYESEYSIKKPRAYIIPASWHKVIQILKNNRVKMSRLENDSTINVEYYQIEDFKPAVRLYEGHYLNTGVKVSKHVDKISFSKGDYYIPMDQYQNRYLVEVLEPESPDGFLAWNFFDSVLSQKEGFSSYVFEETALAHLQKDKSLKKMLDEKKKSDVEFSQNHQAQLQFIFQHSPYFEQQYRRHPIFRVP